VTRDDADILFAAAPTNPGEGQQGQVQRHAWWWWDCQGRVSPNGSARFLCLLLLTIITIS
jgi:hypothetical protein